MKPTEQEPWFFTHARGAVRAARGLVRAWSD
jgi:hypothetical protein